MVQSLRLYYSLLRKYLRPQRSRVVLLAVLLLVGTGLQILNPQILRYFIDAVFAGRPVQSLLASAILYIFVAIGTQALLVLARYFSEQVAWSATNAMRSDLAMHCLSLDMSFHYAHSPGELTQRVDGDITPLANFFSQFVVLVVGNILLMIGVLIALILIDWRVGLAYALIGAVTLVILVRIQKSASSSWAGEARSNADLHGYLEERVSGAEDIRTLGATPYAMLGLFKNMRTVYRSHRKALFMGNMTWAVADLNWGVSTALAVGIGSYLVIEGSATIGTAYLIVHYFMLLGFPLQQITTQMQSLQQASGSLQRIRDILGTESAISNGTVTHVPPGPLSIEFQNVGFSYVDGQPVLTGLSFGLEPGRVLGLLGQTGSGKTTIGRLVLRLYDPDEGRILLSGTDSRDVDLTRLRGSVGLVTQDVQLFQATVRDNLTLFDEGIPDDGILHTIDALGLSAWYSSLPHGLDTVLSPDAGAMSAGQAQLLAFARVFLRDPGLVILDEATSRLDPATEALVERATDDLLVGRTAIVIAHRLSTVQRADEVMILDSGRVVEHADRTELASDPDSRYRHLLHTGLDEAMA